jgi:hypothetical protein
MTKLCPLFKRLPLHQFLCFSLCAPIKDSLLNIKFIIEVERFQPKLVTAIDLNVLLLTEFLVDLILKKFISKFFCLLS